MRCKSKANWPDYQILLFPHMCGRHIINPEKVSLNDLSQLFELFKKIAKSGRITYL
jgi:hypothetical protein